MATGVDLQVRGDVVVVVTTGSPEFAESSKVFAAAVGAARERAKKIVLDHRMADLSNYYGYIVRHAELAAEIGLDGTFRIAHVGTPEQDDVLSFMVDVGRNRGWNTQRFFDFDDALRWLGMQMQRP